MAASTSPASSPSSSLAAPADDRLPFTIDRSSAVPYHDQIYRLLLDEIVSGRLAPGEKVLQEKQYAVRLGVSLAPVRQAFLALAKDGYLNRTRGRGTFVSEPKVASKIHLLTSFTATLGGTGLPVSLRVLESGTRPADDAAAAALALPAGGEVFRLRRVAFLDGEPVALLTAVLPAARFPGLADEVLAASLYEVLERRYGTSMTSARNVIEVVRALPDHASHLQVLVGEAMLQVEAVTRDQHDSPVEFSQVLYRADRFRFEIESHRSDGGVRHSTARPSQDTPPAPSAHPGATP
jgi:GntR family transcriptional regulator